MKGKQQQQHLVKTAQQQQQQCQCSSTGNTSNKYTQNSRVEKIYMYVYNSTRICFTSLGSSSGTAASVNGNHNSHKALASRPKVVRH